MTLIALMARIFAAIGAVAVIYGVIDHQGAREWAAAQRELKAKGESLDWSTFVPPPVKEDQNLAFAPLFVRELNYQVDPKTGFYGVGPAATFPKDLIKMPYGSGGKPAGIRISGWDLAKHTDLETYARVYDQAHSLTYPQPGDPAAGAMFGLNEYKPALEELAEAAAKRPFTRFPIDWETDDVFKIALPQYNLQQQFITALRLRASIEIAEDDTGAAIQDVELALRMCRDFRAEPTLYAHLAQFTCLSLVMTPIWEGMADRRWTAAELSRLQEDVQSFDLLADFQRTIRAERAATGIRGIDYLSAHLGELPGVINNIALPDPEQRAFFQRVGAVAPRGWFDSNRAAFAMVMQSYYVEGVDPRKHLVFPAKPIAATTALTKDALSPKNFLAKLFLPIYASQSRRMAQIQAGLDEAVVACALERYALDHGPASVGEAVRYPEALGELTPTYIERLPTDVISGEAMRYGRTPDGRYRLYEVGWNSRDDGGKVAWQESGLALDREAGDWVWQYTPLEPPPKQA